MSMLTIDVEVTTNGKAATKTLKFNSLALIPIGVLRRSRHDQQEQMWAIFEWAFPPESLTVIDSLPTREMGNLLARMQAVSEVDAGESSPSPKSSESGGTVKRSRQTSSTKA